MSTQFERDMRRVYLVRQQIKALEAEVKDITGQYTFDEATDVPAGDYIAQVRPNVRFDAAVAKHNLSADDYARILAWVPDSATARKVLDPDTYKRTQRDYGWKISVVPVEDEDD